MKPIKDIETFREVLKKAKEEHERLCFRGVSLEELKRQWKKTVK